MSTTTAELGMGPVQARVVSAPLGRDLTQVTRRLAIKRFLCFGLVLGIGISAACYGYRWWTVGRFIESTDGAYVGGEVTVIAPKVSGLIAEVAVTDNQALHAGDLPVKLADRDYRAALAKTAGAVAAKEAARQPRRDAPTPGIDDRAGRSRGHVSRCRSGARAVRRGALSPACLRPVCLASALPTGRRR